MVRAFVLSAAVLSLSIGCNNESSSGGATSPTDTSSAAPSASTPDGTPTGSPTASTDSGEPLNAGADAAAANAVCGVDVDAGVCPAGTTCKSDPPVDVPDASIHNQGVGGHCGGIAGFQCAKGLVCADMMKVPDGMGTCKLSSHCVK
ncbi:MAG TPA: hypothetical protein VF407_08545 [Polyangiaceae bacterium]